MKMIYMCFKADKSQKGVEKKIDYEIKAFNLGGIKVEKAIVKKNKTFVRLLPFQGKFKWREYSDIKDVSAIYIRYGFSSFPLISMLKKIRRNNKKVKIILEIGMYPYDKEFKGFINKILFVRDIIYRKVLKNYVDRVTINTPFEEVFGIKSIQFVNPIEVNKIDIPKRQSYRNDNTINLLAVASLAFYYGYDRLLRGIANYYMSEKDNKANIVFHIVGDGVILKELKELTEKLDINNHVVFYGFKQGKELEDIYEVADVGIDVFGGHRKEDFFFGTIKSREYITKGIPFVTEYPIPKEITPINKYVLKVPADESDIDVEMVVNFFGEIKKETRGDTIKKMRDFAYSYCDISVSMQPIIDYLLEDDK